MQVEAKTRHSSKVYSCEYVMCNHHVAAIDIIMPESTVTIRSQGAMGAMTPLVNALASKVALHNNSDRNI